MSRSAELRVMNEPWYSGYSVMVRQGDMVVTSMTMETIKEGHCYDHPVRLDKKEAQLLMDDLWHCGVRPSDGAGSTGQLKATETHLKDMRRLVFDSEKENKS